MTIGKTLFGMIGEAARVTFRPIGNVSATNVQDAIEELDTEKQPIVSGLTDIAGLTPTDSNIIVGDGSNWVQESGAMARTSLGVAIGADVQAFSARLSDVAGLAITDGNIIVADGSNWVAESGATARSSLGLTIGSDVQAFDAGLGQIAGLAKTDGNFIVGDGTSWVAETGATARTSLGLSIGSDVQAYSARLGEVAALAITDGNIIVGNGSGWITESGATARTSLGLSIGSDVQAYQAAQSTATWELGTGTTESVVSPAKVKAAIDALASGGAAASGSVLQSVYSEYTTHLTGQTNGIPIDSSIPQNTEGVEILSASITPAATANKLRIRYGVPMGSTTAGWVIGAVFRDSDTSAIGSSLEYCDTGTAAIMLVGEFEYSPATTSAVTIKLRVGSQSGKTYYINGSNSVAYLGASLGACLIVEEIKA